jgi:hypothetical protein
MSRSLLGTTAILSLTAAMPASAADYFGSSQEIRPAYSQDWGVAEDSLQFEAGLRYWYSLGEQFSEIGGETYETKDRSHILEGHFRIDDNYTATFLKGQAGMAVVTQGEHMAGSNAPDSFQGGQVGYIGADFGWTPWGNEAFHVGPLVGYQFSRESPDRNRLDVEHVDGLNVHALRLGLSGRADINNFMDINADAAIIPYAYATGATAEIPFADTEVQGVTVNRRNAEATGALHGASGQIMVGFHPTENLTLRVGARATYLTGPSSMRAKQWEASTPDSYLYADVPLSGFELFRYGGLVELTGRF